ncbi:galactosylceramide sulfotransferase-like [Saccoglossus kowalevskii]
MTGTHISGQRLASGKSNHDDRKGSYSLCCCFSLTRKKLAFLLLCSLTAMYMFATRTPQPTHSDILTDSSSLNTCTANKIVYIKTHKTASTTLASIIQKYGYINDMIFAQPPSGHMFSETKLFKREMVQPVSSGYFSLITNHARYNRHEMEAVVSNAIYLTVLREPSAQLESAFGFYKMAQQLNIHQYLNPFSRFLENARTFLVTRRNFHLWTQMRNGQIFDLGLDHYYHDNETAVDEKIRQLSIEIDFVLITEYFDESLVVLKRLLCLDTKDILYLSNGIRERTLHYKTDATITQKAREWNAADVKLYNHFNATLWRKISEYGSDFHEDLTNFRDELRKLTNECIVPNRYTSITKLREDRLVLRPGASAMCRQLWYGDVEYTDLIRSKQKHLYPWLPLYKKTSLSTSHPRHGDNGIVLMWVWLIVFGGVAWCVIACCVAAYCEDRENDEHSYYDDEEADKDDELNTASDTEHDLYLQRKYKYLSDR